MQNNIIDISHYQNPVDFDKLKAAGIVCVIHKATEGNTGVDAKFQKRVPILKDRFLTGAYHYLHGNGKEEAKHFLDIVQPFEKIKLALDFEATESVKDAEDFVQYVFDETGKYPLFYTYHHSLKSLDWGSGSILKNCPLWAARYSSSHPFVPPIWDTFSLWQYTQSGHVDGIKGYVDRNYFNGTLEGLYKIFDSEPPV